MNNKIPKEDVVNQQIENIVCLQAEQHEHTKRWTYSYLIVLGNGKTTLKLDTTSVNLILDQTNFNDSIEIPIQIVEGGYRGEIVKAIIYRSFKKENSKEDVFQYGLLLYSGKVAVNVYRGGGGSILHIETLSGFIQNIGGGWKDYWTGEIVII